MSWKLNKNGVTPQRQLMDAEQQRLNDFMNAIRGEGLHPAESARNARCEYKKLKGTDNQYEIYLSEKNRATFTVDEESQTVTMLQVGGHT
ncbi:MAG: hypothetical protein LBS09_00125 [Bacteroidales bacterium]|jgi:hypothetical protein|nr:hypothetical protein [Bacteroidales bacterium]